jgi:predicted glycogen debranching enzyme
MDVLDTMVSQMQNGDFAGSASAWVAADAPLWFFWTLQNLEKHITAKKLWERYGEAMKSVLEAYRRGFGEKVKLHNNGLVWAAAEGEALTWMNTKVDGQRVAQRAGYAVEIQALWYNAVSYTLALARKMKDKEFVDSWKDEPAKIKESFLAKFWLSEGYLADYVNDYETNDFRRANMLVATALDYTMLSEEQMMDEWLKDRDVCFWDGVEEGKKAMEKQMMEGAVEGKIIKDIHNLLHVMSDVLPMPSEFKFGDRVKIIILKDDEN